MKSSRFQAPNIRKHSGLKLVTWCCPILRALVLGCFLLPCSAAEPTREQLEFFENKIRPVLSRNCYQCHSVHAERVKGGLLLDSRAASLRGGDTGPAVVPGHPEQSLLIKAIRYTDSDLQMPPRKKLSDEQIADLEKWIAMGAPDPRDAVAMQQSRIDPSVKHWAWQPLKKPVVPDVKNKSWAQTPVDYFILAKLEENNLTPNLIADKRTLIRRASFDLIGLPPTPEEVEAFINDASPDAFAKVVDRLLASPHYGERWGRHWLDVARYSDTKGMVRRQREDPRSPYAWTYRDYVIKSFNDDKPYNQFIIEQLAADKLPATKSNPTNLAALGFLTVGERFMGMQHDIINDRIDVVTKGFLGLTVSCARCHDHKFDPIPTQDYYSLHGVFASTIEPPIEPVIQKLPKTLEYRDYQKERTALDAKKAQLEVEFQAARRNRDRDAIRNLQRQLRENASEIVRLEMTHPGAVVRAMAVQDAARPRNSAVFIRGEAENKGEIVPRRFLEILAGETRRPFTNGSGRLELAHAIVNKSNPLTPRVMINRIWQHHFGTGFVPTPDDFGTMSEPPSHPELLDYLAIEFQKDWSIKKIHRLIMLSSVYQQTTTVNSRGVQIDPDNRLLWRANIRRLEFESLRDSLLAVGGSLDRTLYGRPIDLKRNPESTRRTIYGIVDRSDLWDPFVNFDFANPDSVNGRRHETSVPQQALFLMNSPVVIEQARRVVAQDGFVACADDMARIEFLYNRIFQRPPTPEEIELGMKFIAQSKRDESKKNASAKTRTDVSKSKRAPLTDWQQYAHALLQANEFSFVN